MSWSQEELVAAAYGVVFFFVLVYVAIIAAKLVRLQRATEVGTKRVTLRAREYAATVVTRPLPLQAPTAFVRIRPRGARVCGEARRTTVRRCGARTTRRR